MGCQSKAPPSSHPAVVWLCPAISLHSSGFPLPVRPPHCNPSARRSYVRWPARGPQSRHAAPVPATVSGVRAVHAWGAVGRDEWCRARSINGVDRAANRSDARTSPDLGSAPVLAPTRDFPPHPARIGQKNPPGNHRTGRSPTCDYQPGSPAHHTLSAGSCVALPVAEHAVRVLWGAPNGGT